jgi:Na+/proline symporter
MLIGSILLYLALTVGIGVYAAKRVRGSRDFLVAGRSLPLGINVATVFAAWFGAQTVLSVSATFTGEGLRGVPGDPFGASFALFFFAIFFARAFYRMDLLTIGDFYRRRYGKLVEVVTSLTITVSYVGWISAQLTALGLILHVSSAGAWPLDWCILAGALVVAGYTLLGGMWAVALTNVLQTLVIVVGLLLVAWLVGDMAGGPANVIAHAHAAGEARPLARRRPGGVAALRRCVDDDGAGLPAAPGHVPARDQRHGREDRGARLAAGRRGLPRLRLRSSLHRLRRGGHRPQAARAVRLRGFA